MGASNNDEESTAFDVEVFNRAKEEKQNLVLDFVKSHCISDSPIEDFQRIVAALEKNDTLLIQNLSGGYTNFTYKLYLSSDL